MVRSQAPVGKLTAALERAAARTNAGISLAFRPLPAQVQESLLRDRLMATLSSFFAFLAATLATVGLYGVISYMVARRRSEIGIRMALGATRGGVVRLILKEAGLLLMIGLTIGTVLAAFASKAAGALLFGIRPADPLTMALAVFLLAVIATLASFVPARRASRTEPLAALREE